MSESIYADILRQRGFTRGIERPVVPADLEQEHVHHDCRENEAFMELWESKKPFFHILGDHTVAFDELRCLWFAKTVEDLRTSGFTFYNTETREIEGQPRPN